MQQSQGQQNNDNWQGFEKVDQPVDMLSRQLLSSCRGMNVKEQQPQQSNDQQMIVSKAYSKSAMIKREKMFLIGYREEGVKQKSVQIKKESQQKNAILNNQPHHHPSEKYNKYKQQLSHPKRTVPSPTKLHINESRYPRIPIVRYQQSLSLATTIVYKGLDPRSSDSYLRTLKPVDFTCRLSQLASHQWNSNQDIEFGSRFQSGNLNLVYEYDLYMRVDTNTCGHRQWFYFSIKCKSKTIVKLNIYRFKKPYSLYQRGMRPYVKSLKSEHQQWLPGGYNVRYIRQKETNDYGVKKPSTYYYLSFMYQFEHDEDEVFFAAGIPYTYSFLTERLLGFQYKSKLSNTIKFTQHDLGLSPCGLSVPMVKLQPLKFNDSHPKHIIVINCRTHPGETSGSWVLDGLIDCLLSLPQSQYQILTQYNICFHIVPILNPDGVFLGNYRTGIVGDDFNRKFSTGRKDVFPQINCLKRMINSSKKQGKLIMFIDLHGHSMLKNSFIYGPSQTDFSNSIFRKLSLNLSHKSQYFRLSSCKFQTDSQKIQTARMYFQLKENMLSYTCQNSLGLYELSNGQTYQMTRQDWRKFGADIIEGIKGSIQNEKGRFIFYEDTKQQEDLRDTSTPPIKQSFQSLISKRTQTITKLKLKTQKIPNPPSNDQITNSNLQICQNTSKSISITEKVSTKNIRSRKFESPFFSSPNKKSPSQFVLSKQKNKNVVEWKDYEKVTQVRRRLPSLGSVKQGRSRQGSGGQLRSIGKDIGRVKNNMPTDKQKNDKQQKSPFILMTSSQPLPNQQLASDKNFPHNQLSHQNPNPKRQFLQSIYSKRQLNQLRSCNNKAKERFELGSKLTPVIENIKLRLQRKRKCDNDSDVISGSVKMFANTTSVVNNNQSLNSSSASPQFPQSHSPIKKYSCDLTPDIPHSPTPTTLNNFDNIQIALKSQLSLNQRSQTYDQDYLQWQIEKLKNMKQTEQQYYLQKDGQQLLPWQGEVDNIGCEINTHNNSNKDEDNTPLFDEKFSQQFDDSVNDNDSQSQSLPSQQKNHVLEYIRSHNHLRERLKGECVKDSDQQQEKIKSRKGTANDRSNNSMTKLNNNNRKRNINAFREIVFAHGEYLQQPLLEPVPNNDNNNNNINNNINNNDNDDRTTRWNSSANVNTNININTNITKLRKNTHKFKQSLGVIRFKSFSSKIQTQEQKSITPHQDAIYITHKKKLNERNMRRQSRKDPFVLLSRKEKSLHTRKVQHDN